MGLSLVKIFDTAKPGSRPCAVSKKRLRIEATFEVKSYALLSSPAVTT